ncbi:GNAT family N-acetyltransferase [Paenibacillus dakarensis]|uniref:GNAT family N-acetyltransferase n=1 Tax=Paenibacillus dakarensis TaxID=1527293 RepID=UPI0006D57682|nr:GNAT family N-acetyltransferase [Paenibacillus dakarensis]
MITIKRLSECTFREAAEVFNKGFEGYYVPLKVNVDQFIQHLVNGRLSSELSVLAFMDGQPVGFVLNGIQMIDGKKIARNGGTGVIAEYRRSGVGKALMDKTLEIYEEEEVDIAVLEAFSVNEKAIALYEKSGYQVKERLLFLEWSSAAKLNPFLSDSEEGMYQVDYGTPRDAGMLSFYKNDAPSQNHWENLVNANSVLVRSHDGETVGYALYKRGLKPSGDLAAITLFQCEAAPGRQDQDAILKCALSNVFAPYEVDCKRSTFNLPDPNQALIKILHEAGFRQAFTDKSVLLEQVHMYKRMK